MKATVFWLRVRVRVGGAPGKSPLASFFVAPLPAKEPEEPGDSDGQAAGPCAMLSV